MAEHFTAEQVLAKAVEFDELAYAYAYAGAPGTDETKITETAAMLRLLAEKLRAEAQPQSAVIIQRDGPVPAPLPASGKAVCSECGCTTGGGAYCYQHAPYTVWPLKDGSWYRDRNGQRDHLWSEPPSMAPLPASGRSLAEGQPTTAVPDITAVISDEWERGGKLDAAGLAVLSLGRVHDLLAAREAALTAERDAAVKALAVVQNAAKTLVAAKDRISGAMTQNAVDSALAPLKASTESEREMNARLTLELEHAEAREAAQAQRIAELERDRDQWKAVADGWVPIVDTDRERAKEAEARLRDLAAAAQPAVDTLDMLHATLRRLWGDFENCEDCGDKAEAGNENPCAIHENSKDSNAIAEFLMGEPLGPQNEDKPAPKHSPQADALRQALARVTEGA